MKCSVVDCIKEATKIIIRKDSRHDMELPVCSSHANEITYADEITYKLKK